MMPVLQVGDICQHGKVKHKKCDTRGWMPSFKVRAQPYFAVNIYAGIDGIPIPKMRHANIVNISVSIILPPERLMIPPATFEPNPV